MQINLSKLSPKINFLVYLHTLNPRSFSLSYLFDLYTKKNPKIHAARAEQRVFRLSSPPPPQHFPVGNWQLRAASSEQRLPSLKNITGSRKNLVLPGKSKSWLNDWLLCIRTQLEWQVSSSKSARCSVVRQLVKFVGCFWRSCALFSVLVLLQFLRILVLGYFLIRSITMGTISENCCSPMTGRAITNWKSMFPSLGTTEKL